MSRHEYIAYKGDQFSVEWFYDRNGKSQALDYFNKLDEQRQNKVLYLFKRMGDHGGIKDLTKFRNEGSGIFAFKPKPDRFLCFFRIGQKIIVTNAFEKRQDKLPKSEKDRAVERKKEYETRILKEDYYE